MFWSLRKMPEFEEMSQMEITRAVLSIYRENPIITIWHFVVGILSIVLLLIFAYWAVEIFGESFLILAFVLAGIILFAGNLIILNTVTQRCVSKKYSKRSQ